AEQQQQPWPKVKITVSNQPVSSYRHRSDGEINNFNSQGSTKAVGSLLKGRNDNGQGEFIKIALELTDGYQREFDVDGELIVLLVDTNGTIFGEPPLKVHPWNLKGEHCSTADNPNDESSGPLSVDPLKEVQQSVRLLFAFVPDDSQMVLNSYAISEPILCQLGSDGGKSFGVKAFNPVCVYLKRDLQYPMTSDIWVQLEADIKKKSETISAQLLVPCTSAATANPLSVEVSIPVEVQRNLLKLQLTKLEVQDTIANLPEEQFMAKLCLTKESNSSGRLTSSVDVRFIYLNQLKTPSLHNRAKRPRQD
uniref:Integrin_alpha2 domain-containing protein n=1 Tax=Macrostomum lignano TaxID=282301 RepID=A0A1I8GRW8_9PLAT